MSIKINDYFDISDLEDSNLFSDNDIFSALKNLENFLKTKPLGQIKSQLPGGVVLSKAELIFIDEGVTVEPGVCLQGPLYISKGSEIRYGAYLRGNVFLGKDSVVGHSSEIKNSIFLDGAKAPHFAYVGDSILGKKVNLGAGVRCANLKLNKEEVSILVGGKLVKTGLHKLGAIIGDYTQVGCNTVFNPGTLIGKDSIIYPSINLGGFVEKGSIVKAKIDLKIMKRKFK